MSKKNNTGCEVSKEKVPKEIEERLERYENFKKFLQVADDDFKKLRDGDKRAALYEKYNNLAICPGGRWGGTESDILEVFWGKKIYANQYNERAVGKHGLKFNFETGVTMMFVRLPDGYVSIFLYPAVRDREKDFNILSEGSYRLCQGVNPAKLLSKRFQKELWVIFMAYTEKTHLDGNPSFMQRLIYGGIRIFAARVCDDHIEIARIWKWVGSVIKWVLTVGLSGLLLLVVQNKCSDDEVVTEAPVEIKEINEDVQDIQEEQSLIICNLRGKRLSLQKKS